MQPMDEGSASPGASGTSAIPMRPRWRWLPSMRGSTGVWRQPCLFVYHRALAAGISHYTALVSADNVATLALLRRFGCNVDAVRDDFGLFEPASPCRTAVALLASRVG